MIIQGYGEDGATEPIVLSSNVTQLEHQEHELTDKRNLQRDVKQSCENLITKDGSVFDLSKLETNQRVTIGPYDYGSLLLNYCQEEFNQYLTYEWHNDEDGFGIITFDSVTEAESISTVYEGEEAEPYDEKGYDGERYTGPEIDETFGDSGYGSNGYGDQGYGFDGYGEEHYYGEQFEFDHDFSLDHGSDGYGDDHYGDHGYG